VTNTPQFNNPNASIGAAARAQSILPDRHLRSNARRGKFKSPRSFCFKRRAKE
jgi:hypothetical protein